jgi:hypothetical protein
MTWCQDGNPGAGLNLEAQMNIEQEQSFVSIAEIKNEFFI